MANNCEIFSFSTAEKIELSWKVESKMHLVQWRNRVFQSSRKGQSVFGSFKKYSDKLMKGIVRGQFRFFSVFSAMVVCHQSLFAQIIEKIVSFPTSPAFIYV